MKKIIALLFTALTLSLSTQVHAFVVDFEDVSGTTTFNSQGMDFTATGPNLIFSGGVGGAANGTNTFGWCGSGCGGLTVVTASLPGGTPFSIQSIDAGNLSPAGGSLGYVPGMTLDILGNLNGGGTVFQSLLIVENVMTTYSLVGFDNLLSIELTAPAVIGAGTPDPNIDNLVINEPTDVPESATLALLGLGLMGIGYRRYKAA